MSKDKMTNAEIKKYDEMSPKNLLFLYESFVEAHKTASDKGLECVNRMYEAKESLRKYMTGRWANEMGDGWCKPGQS